ncbi:hypothetical protein CBQ26_00535 [Deinococcus indicus]|uniref:Uncharacterized protein n=1 Tax=Deinococcus indicus TaxID=223556 RepID=A0A246BTG7_9DEIO|nr:hypothetical protein CBQ26_00535 [Deinococcus indicus]
MGVPATITNLATLRGQATFDGPYLGGPVGAGIGSIPFEWDTASSGWKNSNTDGPLELPLARGDVLAAAKPQGWLYIDLTWTDEAGRRQSEQLRFRPAAGEDGTLDLTRDQDPEAYTTTASLQALTADAEQAAAAANTAAGRVNDAILDLSAERQAVADIIADTAQQQEANDARQDVNDTTAAATEARLAPFRGVTYPSGVFIGGVEVIAAWLDSAGRPLVWWDAAGGMHANDLAGITLTLSQALSLAAATITTLSTTGLRVPATPDVLYLNGAQIAAPLVQDQTGRVLLALSTDGALIAPGGVVAPNVGNTLLPGGYTLDSDGRARVNGVRNVPLADVVVDGDSLGTSSLAAEIATATGRTCAGYGIGGQTSTEIAARLGAANVWFTVNGGSLPATVTAAPITLLRGPSLLISRAGLGTPVSRAGWLGGVYGTLSATTTSPSAGIYTVAYTFTRSVAAGGATTMNSNGDLWVPDLTPYRDKLVLISMGRNNYTDPTTVRADVDAVTLQLRGVAGRVYLLSIPNGDYAQEHKTDAPNTMYVNILALNDYLGSRYRLIDWRSALAANTTDDLIPASLRGDQLHPNAAGRQAEAQVIKTRFTQDGV